MATGDRAPPRSYRPGTARCRTDAPRRHARLAGAGADERRLDRSYRELPIYRDHFAPFRIDHMMDLALPAGPGRHRSFTLFRRTGDGDFSRRDRAVLEMLRPHFSRLEAEASLRRQLSEALRTRDRDGEPRPYTELTAREREIVELVAEGKTNAQIAAQLWVSPSR